MDWVILSLGLFVSVAANSLVARRLLIKGIPGQLINFVNFFCCFIFYSLFALLSGRQFCLPIFLLAAVVAMSVLFNYLGNVFYMQSIARAPNPGYGLIIMKSSVVMTVLLSIPMFQAAISVKNLLAIAAVLFFVSIIVLDNPGEKKSHSGGKWILPSFGASLCFGFYTLAMKYFLSQGVDSMVFLAYVSGILSLLFFFDSKREKVFNGFGRDSKFFLVFGAILGILANFCFAEAVKYAPNPGYVSAVDAASGALVALAAAWLFKDHLSAAKLIGIIGAVASLAVLLI